MAKGGKQPGAGRPKGSTTRPRVYVIDYFTEKERIDFFKDLKKRSKTDSKLAIYLAEQMTGKAPQAVEMEMKGDVNITFDNAFASKTERDSSK